MIPVASVREHHDLATGTSREYTACDVDPVRIVIYT